MARFSEVVGQTIRLFPNAIAEHLFRDSLENWWLNYDQLLLDSGYTGKVQIAFFISAFSTMGYLSRIDGRVHQQELAFAGKVMEQLKLGDRQKRLAIRLFNEGKQSDFDLDVVLGRFYRSCRHRVSIMQVFMEIQLQTALADGVIVSREQELLLRIAKRLDISESIYKRIEQRVRVGKQSNQASPHKSKAKPMNLANACALLDVSRWDSLQVITKAYRRLISRNHPDKLVGRGSTDAELNDAADKVQEIKWAYEIIRKAKKIR